MHLSSTCGLLLVTLLLVIGLLCTGASVWTGIGCPWRDHRGCCIYWANPRKLRPPCAPKMKMSLPGKAPAEKSA